MGLLNPRDAMQVCVHQCPTSDIDSWQEARDFAIHNNSRLCSYNIRPDEYSSQIWDEDGPCPELPVFKRQVVCLLLRMI